MGDKSWLCIICGSFIYDFLPNDTLPEGGRVHSYCLAAEKVGAADERERIISLIQSIETQASKGKTADHQRLATVCQHIIRIIKGEAE